MATFKHISSKNADYGAAEQYLTFEHDEFTMKPTLDENGRLMLREDYRIATLNCGDEDFAVACMRSNLRYGKNQKREDVKSHHYIISFDPRDAVDNGLTVDRAQALGEEFCRKQFPGHQAIVCTHPDGHNHSGNIHVHIVINSLRMQSFLFYVIFSPACAVMLNKIMYMTSYKMQAEESMRRIDMILTAEPQVETSAPEHPKTYDVSFENVTFAYENTDHPAVSHLSFTAKAGTTTALVGHSGSGKSTTASLIPRFYDVQQGAVKIGGVDIREIPHADLMKMVAFVFQDPKLFKDTLLENIRAGRPSATREEVLQAAHLAQCDDILEKFPDGLDTVVGGKGVYLSGGETQRIAIARAILKDAPIVVLDEATAYADPENEQQIQKAFEGLVKGKTVIMIAHRLSTIQDADLILVMKQGELVESGTHDALVKQGGEYAKMWGNYTKTTKWHIGNEVKVC